MYIFINTWNVYIYELTIVQRFGGRHLQTSILCFHEPLKEVRIWDIYLNILFQWAFTELYTSISRSDIVQHFFLCVSVFLFLCVCCLILILHRDQGKCKTACPSLTVMVLHLFTWWYWSWPKTPKQRPSHGY